MIAWPAGVHPEQVMAASDNYAAGELLVGFKVPLSSDLSRSVEARGLSVVRVLPQINLMRVRVSELEVDRWIELLRRDDAVAYVERNWVVRADFTPNDPYWSSQWGPKKIKADYAWDIVSGGTTLVAIVDSGIDYRHSDLAANYQAGGWDWVNGDNDPRDDYGHGTHVAGTVAAVTNNARGIAGVAQVKVIAEKILDSRGSGYVDDAASAIIHATDLGAKILSNSWGTDSYSYTLQDAVRYAYDRGALLVAAAGNSECNCKSYPAAYPEVVAVGATDSYDKIKTKSWSSSWGSNWGDWIEVSAPGVNIYSTVLNGGYASMSGTSMATPHVSGVAALVWSRDASLSRDDIRSILDQGVDDLGTPGKDPYYGWGRINAYKAVKIPQPSQLFDFSLSVTPSSETIVRGETATYSVSVQLVSGTSQPVSLSLSGLPDDATHSFSPSSGDPTFGSTLTISTTTNTPDGTYSLTIYGDAGALRRTVTAAMIVQSFRVEVYTFTGSLSSRQKSPLYQFNVPSGATKIEITLDMPSGWWTNFDLSLFDNQNRRTGGRWGSEGSTKQIPNSQYSGTSARPEWITVNPPASIGTWSVAAYSYSGYGSYKITVKVTVQLV